MANVSMDTLMIEIQSSTKNATSSIQSLINKLKTLNQSLESVMKQSENFSKLKTSIDNVTKGINIPKQSKQTTPNINMDNVKPTGNISGLASQSTVLSKQGSLLANYRSQLQAVGLSQSDLSKKMSQTTNQTTKSKTEITKYDTELGKLTVTARTAADGLTRYATSLKNVGNESKKNTNLFKAMTSGVSGTLLQAQVVWNTLKGTATTLGDLAMNGASYYESLNLFATTLGDKAQEAMDWVNMFSDALYLDPSNVMQYMGTFDSLIEGLGVGADDAYLMSQQLTQLTYDLSSFKNLDIETAFEKLRSGIAGELEPLRSVGVALSDATLQELAYSLGIEKSTSAMSEAEKVQLRYIQIMKSSIDWQADMGKTLTSPANAIRVMKEQFTLLGRAIGNVFIPIIMFALPYVMVFTEILTNLANALADLLEKVFGIKLDFSLDTGDFDTSIGDITGGLEDIGDTADKTKNKLNTMLAPFDELNNVQTKSNKDGSGDDDSGLGGDLGVDLPAYDALSKLTDQFKKNVDEAKKNLEGLLPIIVAIAGGIAAWKLINFIGDIQKTIKGFTDLQRIVGGLVLSIGGIALTISGNADILNEDTLWQGIAKQLGGSVLLGAGVATITKNIKIGLIVAGMNMTVAGSITMSHGDEENFWGGIAEAFAGIGATAVGTFMQTKSLTVTLAVTAVTIFGGVSASLGELIDMEPTMEEIEGALANIPWGVWLGDALYNFTEWLSGISEGINNFFIGIGNAIGDAIYAGVQWVLGIPEWIDTNVIQPVATFFSDLWTNVKQLASDTWEGIKSVWNSVASWFNDNIIQPIANFFSNMWKTIKSLASGTWENIKTVWNAVTGWFNDTIIKPIGDFFSGMWDGIKNGASKAWDGVKSVFGTVVSFFSGIVDKVKSMFGSIGTFVVNAISDTFKSVLNGAFTIIEKPINFFISAINGAIGVINKIPGVKISKLDKIELPRFEDGGYPDSDLFLANENGIPEMVGRIGNQTAVANNDQITDAISNAVLQAINNSNFGNNSSGPTTIYIGNKKVYEGFGDHVQRENDRYGTNMIRI